jgi:hypothetical protein
MRRDRACRDISSRSAAWETWPPDGHQSLLDLPALGVDDLGRLERIVLRGIATTYFQSR